ncbi:MAG: hybrid sensor histidine kinase/response regulator [Fermentimonas sp.]
MNKRKGSSKAKATVIIGYLLVMIVMGLGLVDIYKNLEEYSNKRAEGQDFSELLIVSNTLSLLYEIESEQNLVTSQSAWRYFQKYDSIVPVVSANLTKLKSTAIDSARVMKLDSIEMLVGKKKENLQVVAALLDSIRRAPHVTRSIESSHVARELNQEIVDYLGSKDLRVGQENKSDTSVVMGERKGFFSRIRDAIVGHPDSTIVIESKSKVTDREFELIVDTIINKVIYSEQLDLQNQRRFQAALLARQKVVTQTNHLLTVRINELLTGIEQEEMMKSFQLLIDREEVLARSQVTIHWYSFAAVGIAMLFATLFLVDINRGQRYRRQLEASNQRVTELLASRERMMLTISHDIKAPVSSILGYLELYMELLKERADKASEAGKTVDVHLKIEEYVSNMQHSGQHVLQLASSLLDYHKLEAGVWQMQPSNINLHALVEDTGLSFKPMAARKKLDYRVDNKLSEETIWYADAYVIRQVMGNLISNAIKYTSEGEVAIEVLEVVNEKGKGKERGKEAEAASCLLLKVSDTGPGIGKEEQSQIFQDFTQLDHADPGAERVEGSGLGLAITKGFVEQMNGTIRVESERGVGSLFIVELPLQPVKGGSEMEGDIGGKVVTLPKGFTVLVVDDDPVQLKMVAEMLKKANVEAVTEGRPERVTSWFRERRFHLLFVDLQMPGMNGFALVKEIRRLEGDDLRNLPVIALSARSDVSEEILLNAGFTGYLVKPFSFAQLCETLFKYLGQRDTCATHATHTTDSANTTNVNDTEGAEAKVTTVQDAAEKGTGAKGGSTIVTGAKALIDFVEEDKEVSLTILNSFVEETTQQIGLLKVAFEESDAESAGEIAHRVLPLIQMIGDETMTGRLKRLEKREPLPKEEEGQLLVSLEARVEEAKWLAREIEGVGE